MRPRVLIAGIGNIFLGDDAFGVEVARRLADVELPEWVRVADYGTSGMHLAFDLCTGYDVTILIDTAARGEVPGTLSVLELTGERGKTGTTGGMLDAHGMQPDVVLELLGFIGGDPGRVLLVACEPEDASQRMGLTKTVCDAVDPAVGTVRELVRAEQQRFAHDVMSQEV